MDSTMFRYTPACITLIVMWGLKGFCRKQDRSYFLCGAPHLITSNAYYSGSFHCRLSAAAMGAVHLKLEITIRFFE